MKEVLMLLSVKGLIDGRVEPELFTTKLQKELNSSPQVDNIMI